MVLIGRKRNLHKQSRRLECVVIIESNGIASVAVVEFHSYILRTVCRCRQKCVCSRLGVYLFDISGVPFELIILCMQTHDYVHSNSLRAMVEKKNANRRCRRGPMNIG